MSYTVWGSGPMADIDKQRLEAYGGWSTINQMFNKWWHIKIKTTDNRIVESYIWCDVHMLQYGHAIIGKALVYVGLSSTTYLNFYFDGRKYWFTNS